MAKRFSVGDILIFIGAFAYFVFMLILFIQYLDEEKFNFVAAGQLMLLLMTGIPIVFTILSLKNVQWIKINYAFCLFIVLLKVSDVSTIQAITTAGLDFFILFSVLVIGIGAYLSENFPSLVIVFQQEEKTLKSVLKEQTQTQEKSANEQERKSEQKE